MRVRYLDSRDVETLPEALAKAATPSREMDIATAFLTRAGAEQVLYLVRRLAGPRAKQQVRVLVGTWLGVTDPAALRQVRGAAGVQLRIAKTPGFHVKHLSFRGTERAVAFTGSANMTAKGLGGVGELVVEVSDQNRSLFASAERDAFRRLWQDAYPEELTDEIIKAYAVGWKPARALMERGSRPGRKLFRRFGQRAAATSAPKDDGSVLWFPTFGTLSDPTVDALERMDPAGKEFLGLGSKTIFERVKRGTRQTWLLDLRGRPKDRSLGLYSILREVELPTDDDGRYFAILSRPRRRILLKENARRALKALKLVARIDSLTSSSKVLRPGKASVAARLQALSQATR